MAYANRGTAYQALRVYGRAIADLTKALEIQPNHPLMLNNRAYAYSRNGEPAKALADMKAALALDPDNAHLHHSLGDIYFDAGETDKATEAWQAVCRLVSAEQTRKWQRALTIRGHYAGAVDGVCNDALIDAFRACARERCILHS